MASSKVRSSRLVRLRRSLNDVRLRAAGLPSCGRMTGAEPLVVRRTHALKAYFFFVSVPNCFSVAAMSSADVAMRLFTSLSIKVILPSLPM